MGAELRVHRWMTSFLILWMGSKNTRVPLIRMKLVQSTGVGSVGGSKKLGVRAGGTRSIPDWRRNLRMWVPWSRVQE